MENKVLKFTTSLNCGGCVAKVQADFDSAKGVEKWEVDFSDPHKILTVHSSGITEDEIIEIVEGKGFTIEVVN